jgi:hypothetical protein
MTFIHKIYPLTCDDTLTSVANVLDRSVNEIKKYHNEHANEDDIIETDFPLHLRSLLLPPDKNAINIEAEKIPIPTPLNVNNAVAFIPSSQKIKYGVQYLMENGDKMNTLNFECTVEWKEIDEVGNHLFEIDRTTITFINNKESDTLSTQLAAKAGSIFYPLQIVVNKNGQWLDVYNHKELKERFAHTKQEMLDYYKGDFAENYIMECESIFDNKTSLKNALKGDLFLNSFFTDIYVNYPQSLMVEKYRDFPLQAHVKAPQFKITQEVASFLDEYGRIIIEQNGVINDERSLLDFENELDYSYYASLNPDEPKAEGNFEATYCINPKTNTIESIVIYADLELKEAKSVTVMIATIEENNANKTEVVIENNLKTSVLVDA